MESGRFFFETSPWEKQSAADSRRKKNKTKTQNLPKIRTCDDDLVTVKLSSGLSLQTLE